MRAVDKAIAAAALAGFPSTERMWVEGTDSNGKPALVLTRHGERSDLTLTYGIWSGKVASSQDFHQTTTEGDGG